jgi:TPR repeat protein
MSENKRARFLLLILYSVYLLLGAVLGSTCEPALASNSHKVQDQKTEADFLDACESVKKHNFADAHAKLNVLADKNHAKSMTLVGFLYERGLGVEKNVDKAAQYYEKAAAKGLPEAESRMGHLLLNSENKLQKQTKSATYWIQKAANHGVSEAEATLGKLYYEGNHLPIKNSEAVRWLRRAADKGHEDAQHMLDEIPALKAADERFHQTGAQYKANMDNLEKSWQGYADVVKSVNAINAEHVGNNP